MCSAAANLQYCIQYSKRNGWWSDTSAYSYPTSCRSAKIDAGCARWFVLLAEGNSCCHQRKVGDKKWHVFYPKGKLMFPHSTGGAWSCAISLCKGPLECWSCTSRETGALYSESGLQDSSFPPVGIFFSPRVKAHAWCHGLSALQSACATQMCQPDAETPCGDVTTNLLRNAFKCQEDGMEKWMANREGGQGGRTRKEKWTQRRIAWRLSLLVNNVDAAFWCCCERSSRELKNTPKESCFCKDTAGSWSVIRWFWQNLLLPKLKVSLGTSCWSPSLKQREGSCTEVAIFIPVK